MEETHFQIMADIRVPYLTGTGYRGNLIFLEGYLPKDLLRKVFIKLNIKKNENYLNFSVVDCISSSSFSSININYSKLALGEFNERGIQMQIRTNELNLNIETSINTTELDPHETVLMDNSSFLKEILLDILKK